MNKSLKSILAILLALSIVACFAACGKKDETPAQTTAAAEQVNETIDENPVEEPAATSAVDSTEPSSLDASEPASAEGDSSAADESTSAAAAIVAPTAKADILALYNKSINDTFAARAGFYKERITDNENLDAGIAFKAFKSLVYKFMGIGADNKYTETVTKGKWDSDAKKHFLRKSTLADADVTGAVCKASGKNIVITLTVKNGSSKGSASKSFTNAPIDKCGICVGNEDKGYYDHKTGAVIFDAIDDTFSKAVVDESYTGAKIVLTIDAATGHIVTMSVTYNVKTTIATNSVGTATATGTSHISYKNFKY